jgi:predicted nucleotidyltransferase
MIYFLHVRYTLRRESKYYRQMRSIQQSYLRHPLTNILGSAAAVRILRALFIGQNALSATQLAIEAKLSRPGVHSTLDSLIGQQLVKPHGAGRSQLYSIDPAHPLAQILEQLFTAERERYDALMAALRNNLRDTQGVQAAWIYGSVARGEDGPRSDFDLALVVEHPGLTAEKARNALAPLEERFGIQLSIVDLGADDIARLIEQKAPWWQEVIRDARVLLGQRPEHYAASLKRQGASQ